MKIQLDPAKALRPLVRSDYWDPLAEVLEQRKSNCIKQLLNCSTDDLYRLQGQVQELDYLLNLKTTINAALASDKKT